MSLTFSVQISSPAALSIFGSHSGHKENAGKPETNFQSIYYYNAHCMAAIYNAMHVAEIVDQQWLCLLYTSPSPRD